ncbi:HD domain-containing protein [Chryseolinea lacunae]|uniref:Metal-dependent HD superfamily phosphohydrolase n=1 Tax=Chryseolinea lacunae TaxID=2801331 RepID=A0ABS1KRD5_9BACT|nr:hypothetical protein [Chryseolinea lacunae]MBL0741890.1 hypothetical protein [Chryseolinea lacunae]
MLVEDFRQLALTLSSDTLLVERLWREIEARHAEKGRHYHTLQHLNNVVAELERVKPLVEDWSSLIFATAYHDVVYDALRKDNEGKSALLAKERLTALSCQPQRIDRVVGHILATKAHVENEWADTNFFTDADLSVLGAPWEEYEKYYRNIRKEYSIYPDLLYNPGRRKVLQHFLDLKAIFKTEAFRERYEDQARKNLVRELEAL